MFRATPHDTTQHDAPTPHPCLTVLCAQVYYNGNKMSRNSAPREEKMVMAGMRVPRRTEGSTHFGRYSGDTGDFNHKWSIYACLRYTY